MRGLDWLVLGYALLGLGFVACYFTNSAWPLASMLVTCVCAYKSAQVWDEEDSDDPSVW